MDTLNYFIDPSDLPLQNTDVAFGPLEDGTYQVSSMFNGGDSPMAYAVNTGIVFIVSQANNVDRVNLFLVPDDNPYGPSVRYFVYRGLLKSDFLDQSNSYIGIKPQADDDSDFITNLRLGQNPSVALDLHDDLADDYFINDLFYNSDYQFGQVTQGDSIGRFDSQLSYGFEIMLDEQFFIPTLDIARVDNNKVDTSNDDTGVATLQILNYIDPAAYFGYFSHSQFTVGTNDTSSTSDSKDDVYNNFLAKFATKNNFYIDIRDQYGRPMDWFDISPTDIKLTTNGSSALSSDPIAYRNNSEFPIRVISNGFTNVQSASNGQQYFQVIISFPTNGLESSPLLTLNNGFWLESVTQISDNLINSVLVDNSGWSNDTTFIVFAVNNLQVANYIKIEIGDYFNLDAIQTQIISDDDYNNDQNENSDNYYFNTGLFPFYIEGLPVYQAPQ